MAPAPDAASTASTLLHDQDEYHELPLPIGMLLGENGRPAFSETESRCLDFFFQAVPSLEVAKLHNLCEAAWYEDSQMALALIFQLGNTRKNCAGKQDRKNFYRAMLWLYENHPKTFLRNLKHVHKHSSLKCLLDLLMFVMHKDNDGICNLEASLLAKKRHDEHRKNIRIPVVTKQRRKEKRQRQENIRMQFAQSMEASHISELRVVRSDLTINPISEANPLAPASAGSRKWLSQTTWASEAIAVKWKEFVACRDRAHAEAAQASAKSRWHTAEAQALLTRFDQEGDDELEEKHAEHAENVKRAFCEVADIFAQGLKAELASAQQGKPVGGLFGKWAPTPKHMHDKATGLVDAITARLYPDDARESSEAESSNDSASGTSEDAETLRIRKRIRYQKEVLSYLRGLAKIPEHYVGSGAWGEVDYARMPSRCRLLYGASLFGKHDRDRYTKFLTEAATLHSTSILPHEVTNRAFARLTSAGKPSATADLAALEEKLLWQSLVRGCVEARAHGDLGWMVPVCDVSGSMSGEPMDVAVALSLLLAQSQTDSPWRGKLFTFHSQPRLVDIPMLSDVHDGAGELPAETLPDLGEMVRFVRGMPWGMNTDIDALFAQLLAKAVEEQLSAAQVSRMALVIFSDMEFDTARAGTSNVPWETAHEGIRAKFADAGFGAQPPVIIYWNLRASRSTPVQDARTPGVILMSGFSAGLLRGLLSGNAAEHARQQESEDQQEPENQPQTLYGPQQRPEVTPFLRMQMSIAGPLYQALAVARADELEWPTKRGVPWEMRRRQSCDAALKVLVDKMRVDQREFAAGAEAARKCLACRNAPKRGLVASGNALKSGHGSGRTRQRKSKVFGRPATSRPIGRYDAYL